MELLAARNNIPNIFLSGDFNVPSIDWNSYSVASDPQYDAHVNSVFFDIVNQFSLIQRQLEPTRGFSNPDLMFTTNANLIVYSSVHPGMIDHDVVVSHVKSNIKLCEKFSHKIFLFDKRDLDSLCGFLQTFSHHLNRRSLYRTTLKTYSSPLQQTYRRESRNFSPQKCPNLNILSLDNSITEMLN